VGNPASNIGHDFGGINDQETGWRSRGRRRGAYIWAPAAQAAPPEPFTITQNIDFNTGEVSFTATGALCPSGTFENTREIFAGNHESASRINIQIRTVFICDNGDTFFAHKHVHTLINEDGSDTTTRPVILKGGTGAFTRLSGHGMDNGSTADGIGVREISGVLKLR
jgi:hypothetical protein